MMYVLLTEDKALYNVCGSRNNLVFDTYPEPTGKRYGKEKLILHKYSDINDAIKMRDSIKLKDNEAFVIQEWRTETGLGKIV